MISGGYNTARFAGSAIHKYPGLLNEGVTAANVANAIIAAADPDKLMAGLDRDQFVAEGSLDALLHVEDTPVSATFTRASELLGTFWRTEPTADFSAAVAEASTLERPETQDEILDRIWGRKTVDVEPIIDDQPTPVEEVEVVAPEIDVATLLQVNAKAARAVERRRAQILRRAALLRLAAGLAIGLVAGTTFAEYAASRDHPIITTVPVITSVQVPYTVTNEVDVTAGTLNELASNFKVPANTTAVDKRALAATLAHYKGMKLTVAQITGKASEAPVNGSTFYPLPPSGPNAASEAQDLRSETQVAATRADDAVAALSQAAKYEGVPIADGAVRVTAPEVVPPTAAQMTEVTDAAQADHIAVAALVADFYHDPNSVPVNARGVLEQILSDNQGFIAKLTFSGVKTVPQRKFIHRVKEVKDYLALNEAKAAMAGALAGLGLIFGALATIPLDSDSAQKRAARRVRHLRRPAN